MRDCVRYRSSVFRPRAENIRSEFCISNPTHSRHSQTSPTTKAEGESKRRKQMNGYKAFYRGRTCEVYAETTLKAQQKAADEFKAKKQHEVSVVLCETNTDGSAPGKQVVHSAAMFG